MAVLAVIAVVLVVTLGDDEDDSAANAAVSCAPGYVGIKVDPQTGESITCDGSEYPGAGQGEGAAPPTAGPDNSPATIDDSSPNFIVGTWNVEVTGVAYGTTPPSDGQEYTNADLPSSMTWVVSGQCESTSACSLSLDMGQGTTIPLNYSPADEKFIGAMPLTVDCELGSGTGEFDLYIYDFSAGDSLRGATNHYGVAPCAVTNKTHSLKLTPA